MSCSFRYCLVVLCVFLIEVLLSSIWTSFGALSVNNFICSPKKICKYEHNTWLLLFFICWCRFIEIWVELHCRYLHTRSDKSSAIFTHQKYLYTMPVFLVITLVLSSLLPYGPQFIIYGVCGGTLVGITSAHVKYHTKMFHDQEIPERQYNFIVHLGRSTSLMLTSVLVPLAIRHYYGIFTTRLLLAILMANLVPLVKIISAGSMPETKNLNSTESYVRYESVVYDSGDFGPLVVIETTEENTPEVLSPEGIFERDIQAAIHASVKDSLKIKNRYAMRKPRGKPKEVKVEIQENPIQNPNAKKKKWIMEEEIEELENIETIQPIEDNTFNVSSPEEEFERDMQEAIYASVRDLFKISNQDVIKEPEVAEVEIHENPIQNPNAKKQSNKETKVQSPKEKKCKTDVKIIEIEDRDKIEVLETVDETRFNKSKDSSEVGTITPRRFSWSDHGPAPSSDSEDSSPPHSKAVIYGTHAVQIHDEPLFSYRRKIIRTASSSSVAVSPGSSPINVQELDQIDTLPDAKPRKRRLKKASSLEAMDTITSVKDFQEYFIDYFNFLMILKNIVSYPSVLSVLYSNTMCLIYLASFPFMFYQRRVQQENSKFLTIEEATFFSLFFLGLCWHAILWFLYYFPKYIFAKYVFGFVLLGSSLLLYFLTDYVHVTWPIFGLGYGITSYLENDLYAYFTQSDRPERVIFNFRVVTVFSSLLTCAILPVLAGFITILSVYSAVPFLVLAISLFTVMKQKVNDEQQTPIPAIKRARRRNYRNTAPDPGPEEENEDFVTLPVDDFGINKDNPRRNYVRNLFMQGGFSQLPYFHDILVRF